MSASVDWYQATIPASSVTVREWLASACEASWTACPPRWGYETGSRLEGPDGPLCTILEGGRNPLPHVVTSGATSDGMYRVIRDGFPDHRVSRIDVRLDLDEGAGTFEKLLSVCMDVAHEHGLSHTEMGDWIEARRGRTLYLGAPQSRVRIRLYEKGLERVAAGVIDRGSVSESWCRLELQLRPQGSLAKARVARMHPEDAWGSSPGAADLLRRVTGQMVARSPIQERLMPTDLRQRLAAVRQYGAILEKWAEELGGWAFLGTQLRDELDKQRRGA